MSIATDFHLEPVKFFQNAFCMAKILHLGKGSKCKPYQWGNPG